jgi:hypothetical protein
LLWQKPIYQPNKLPKPKHDEEDDELADQLGQVLEAHK